MSFHGQGVGGRSHGHWQAAGKLVTKPLDKYDDLTGKSGVLSAHGLKDYHKSSVVAMENFKLLDKNKHDYILSRLDLAKKNKKEQKKLVLLRGTQQ